VVGVRAAAWNYRDVLVVQGALTPDRTPAGQAPDELGLDCAGVVTEVGPGVTRWRIGDRVFGFVPAAFASHAVASQDMLGPIPGEMSFTEAATLPTAWLTIHCALARRARLRPGDTVLVHSGAGGVGLAAIHYARQAGARVIATAGTPEKRELLRLLGVEHVLGSRDLAFADEVMEITDGRGVDVVLNSLAGEALDAGLRLVRPGGHFLELGKRDAEADNRLAMGSLTFDSAYHLIDVMTMFWARPDQAAEAFAEVVEAVHSRAYRPLPHRVFVPGRVADSYALLAHSRHLGKVVLDLGDGTTQLPAWRPEEPLRLDPGATYLVVGGTGGFGAFTATWLAERGARHLVITSRRGGDAPEAAATVAAIEAAGAHAEAVAVDATDADAMAVLLDGIDGSGHPLRGVVHAAMVLHESPLADLTDDAIGPEVGVKADGAELLDALTRARKLDFFWLYSSMLGTIGTIRIAAYAAANLHVEAVARARRQAGLPALALALGPVSDTGYVARGEAGPLRDYAPPVSARSSMRVPERFRDGPFPVLVPTRIHWSAATTMMPLVRTRRFGLIAGDVTDSGEPRMLLDAIRGETGERALALISDALAKLLAAAMETTPDRLDRDRPINQFGVDSLMAVEVQSAIWRSLQCDLSTVRILAASGINALAALIRQTVTGTASVPGQGGSVENSIPSKAAGA
jgi:NADPH:quinone reductase-like Zn-dependent oxidoreductase